MQLRTSAHRLIKSFRPLLPRTPLLLRAAMSSSATPAVAPDEVRQSVKQYYEELKTSDDLKTSACKACVAPPKEIRALLLEVPEEVTAKFYGCGTPLPLGTAGLRVLDLGCGSGRDCYVASRLVGEAGSVTGLDMTPAQLEVAIRNAESYSRDICKFAKTNMKFIQGEIEYLDRAGIPDESQDIVISNCVINLSPDKPRVLREVYRVLSHGGEMYFSDVYCDRRLPKEVASHPVMLGECLGGALYINDFISICRQVGFTDPRCLSVAQISVDNAELQAVAGDAKFFSVTFRLFKLPGQLEEVTEDYGHVALYNGKMPGSPLQYDLDDQTRLVTGQATHVDANTACMLSESWLAKYFAVTGDRSLHRGQFARSPLNLAEAVAAAKPSCCAGDSGPVPAKPSCCGGDSSPAPAVAKPSCCGGDTSPAPAAANPSCCGGDSSPAPAVAKPSCCGGDTSPAPAAAKPSCCGGDSSPALAKPSCC